MSFFNHSRDERIRDVNRRKLQGVVVNNKDPLQLQRVKVRIHDLHDQISDEDLPWFPPHQMSPYSGAANIGDHGPIPPKGTKIWTYFDDDSQYHGTFGGAVQTTVNKVPEFTSKDNSAGGNNQSYNNSSSTATNGLDGEGAGGAGTAGGSSKTTLPDASQYAFYDNYPDSHGHVNESGSILARDQKTDLHSEMHVTSTGHAVDGMGNHFESVNGDTERKDNPNAKKIFPTGKTMVIKGNWTLYTSGNVVINSTGNTTLATTGNTTISSKGNMTLQANGTMSLQSQGALSMTSANSDVTVSSNSGNLNLHGSSAVKLGPGTINLASGSVLGPTPHGSGSAPPAGSASSAPTAPKHDSPQPRTRPNPTFPDNDLTY